jgi:pyruvate-ferredoxin/flavodoxin oxidoreductase
MDQTRYASLTKEFPDEAETLFAGAEADAKERFAEYQRLAQG